MFKIGEKVVCVMPITNYLTKGEIYTISGIYPCSCGVVLCSWGAVGRAGVSNCHCCDKELTKRNELCALINRFRKLDYEFAENILAEISEAMKREEILN